MFYCGHEAALRAVPASVVALTTLVFLEALPKSGRGKIDYAALRQLVPERRLYLGASWRVRVSRWRSYS